MKDYLAWPIYLSDISEVKKWIGQYRDVLEIKNIQLNNGLTQEENVILFNTVYVDEAVQLILKGAKYSANLKM